MELVGAEVAVGVFGVAAVVDGPVAHNVGHDPPEQHRLPPFGRLPDRRKQGGVDAQLEGGPELNLAPNFLGDLLSPGARHAVAGAGVVGNDAHRGADEAAEAVLEVAQDVDEGAEVSVPRLGDALELEVVQLLARVEGGELGVLVDIERVDAERTQ